MEKVPFVFISHDTRDAELAEAFSNLLKKVSIGCIDSFRSSDKKGAQGIKYGKDWFKEILTQIEKSTDVVCLLTLNSVNRPWILYEAGVAHGRLNKTVIGVALGIPIEKANTGPFALFHNCADDEDSLTKLMFELVSKIPYSQPNTDVIKKEVKAFRRKFLQNRIQLKAIENYFAFSLVKYDNQDNKPPEFKQFANFCVIIRNTGNQRIIIEECGVRFNGKIAIGLRLGDEELNNIEIRAGEHICASTLIIEEYLSLLETQAIELGDPLLFNDALYLEIETSIGRYEQKLNIDYGKFTREGRECAIKARKATEEMSLKIAKGESFSLDDTEL